MPVVNTVQGDITSTEHHCHIIIGMNTELQDVRGIGRRVLMGYEHLRELSLGSVITFPWDDSGRELYLLICHKLHKGGWDGAERHVRYGLDHIAYRKARSERGYGIVEIGTGRVGQRDGADPTAIHTAMATSFLPLTVFQFTPPKEPEPVMGQVIQLFPSSTWSMETGERQIAA